VALRSGNALWASTARLRCGVAPRLQGGLPETKNKQSFSEVFF
jgi:hypothetical protein